MTDKELIAEARKASRAVYLATDEPVADDLSRILKALADALERSTTETREAQAKVITICGSSKFKNAINAENARLTLAGNVVISLGMFGHTDLPDYDWERDTSALKRMLDDLHFQKIRMADAIHVVDVNGYIGESTRREIAYAESLGKPVTFMSVVVSDVAEDTPSEAERYVLERTLLDHVHTPDGRCACGHRYVGPMTHLKVAYHVADAIRASDPARYGVTPTPTLCGHGDACELPAGHPGWHHFPGPRGVTPKAGA